MTAEAIALSPYMTEEEIDEICKPLTQHHAQWRHMCAFLGVDSLPRRPDGLPLVGRKMLEERLNRAGKQQAASGISWSK
ncbi:hypothetical protein [Delftia sp. PE138]|uniref:hypothetical protein n=1 Tax=Delftia sp. PE138 TaxID=1812483 RepID=UPI001BAEE3EA|nr:hypothetical protein [Delftia sp. PE138]MBS3719403.1 hypothetical protein [Delftia sp. PE138]